MKTKKLLQAIFMLPALMLAVSLQAQDFELVKDINPNGDSNLEHFTEYNGKLYFQADDGTHDRELWVTDGTATGTLMLKDINPNGSGYPEFFTEYNGKLYFNANDGDGTNGRELWVTDGTTAGTLMLKDINPNEGEGGNPHFFTEYNGKLYFSAIGSTNGFELWVTDGTATGTLMLKDINPNGSGYPEFFTEYNGKLYFSAYDGTNGRELWVTDGTTAGTQMLKDLEPNGDSDPREFTEYDGKLYFTALNSIPEYYSTRQLWVTDGTIAGTVVVSGGVADSQQGVYNPENLIVYDNHLYFSGAADHDGKELWKSDGTTAGTQMLKNINTANYEASSPQYLYVYNGKLYFTASDGSNGRELWESDGTQTGTVKIQPAVAPNSNPLNSGPYFTEFDGSLYFSANFDGNGRELWKITTENLSTEVITQQNILKAYPNPVNNVLNLASQEAIKNVTIVDMTGKTVYSNSYDNNEVSIDISGLQQAMYLVQIKTNGQAQVIKISKN